MCPLLVTGLVDLCILVELLIMCWLYIGRIIIEYVLDKAHDCVLCNDSANRYIRMVDVIVIPCVTTESLLNLWMMKPKMHTLY